MEISGLLLAGAAACAVPDNPSSITKTAGRVAVRVLLTLSIKRPLIRDARMGDCDISSWSQLNRSYRLSADVGSLS